MHTRQLLKPVKSATGLGECELRFFCKVAVQQIKEKTQAHFTSAPAVDTARHAAIVAISEHVPFSAGPGRPRAPRTLLNLKIR